MDMILRKMLLMLLLATTTVMIIATGTIDSTTTARGLIGYEDIFPLFSIRPDICAHTNRIYLQLLLRAWAPTTIVRVTNASSIVAPASTSVSEAYRAMNLRMAALVGVACAVLVGFATMA